MENGLGILGWGVGGIEAEAAMLGQPISMLIPKVVGFRLTGALPQATTATDLVLTITEMLRKHGVVGKFVEFHGDGVGQVPVANRATIGNMSPEFGSTCAIFPIDEATIDYLRLTGRPEDQLDLVEKYARAQGLWHDPARELRFSEELTLDLSTVVPSIAGPEAPAGPDRAVQRQARVPRRAAGLHRRQRPERHVPGLRRDRQQRHPPDAPGQGHARGRHARRPSTTATWSSPRSPPAPTPPTRT